MTPVMTNTYKIYNCSFESKTLFFLVIVHQIQNPIEESMINNGRYHTTSFVHISFNEKKPIQIYSRGGFFFKLFFPNVCKWFLKMIFILNGAGLV